MNRNKTKQHTKMQKLNPNDFSFSWRSLFWELFLPSVCLFDEDMATTSSYFFFSSITRSTLIPDDTCERFERFLQTRLGLVGGGAIIIVSKLGCYSGEWMGWGIDECFEEGMNGWGSNNQEGKGTNGHCQGIRDLGMGMEWNGMNEWSGMELMSNSSELACCSYFADMSFFHFAISLFFIELIWARFLYLCLLSAVLGAFLGGCEL